ncbi:MAG: alpha-ketoglutarate-dependent dioxygenase AlkB [Candidatus Binatia bacterium]
MFGDLLPIKPALEPISIQDAEVYYLRELLLAQSAEAVMRQLIDQVPWRAENIFMWRKSVPQPRLVAWFGDREAHYTYSGVRHDPLPWTPVLLDIRKRVEGIASTHFNSVLLNYYRNHRDSMGLHSDDEPELGPQPVIASLSLGGERIFIMKHKTRRELKSVRLRLASGSLLLMKGETQHYWKHGIDKQAQPCGPRVNLTFRRICR